MPVPDPSTEMFQGYASSGRAKAIAGVEANPEEAARVVQLSDTTGTPAPVIAPDVDGFEKLHREYLTSELVSGNPQLLAYVHSHPMAASVSNRDWGTLDQLSNGAGTLAGALKALNAPFDAAARAGAKEAWERLQEPIPQYTTEDIARAVPAWGGQPGILSKLSGALATGTTNLAALLLGGGSNIFSAVTGGVGAAAGAFAGKAGVPGAEQLGRDVQAMTEYQMFKPEHGGLWSRAGVEPPRGIHPEIDTAKAQVNAQLVQEMDQFLGAAQASETRELSPELFRNFMEQHYGRATVGIQGDAVVALYGDKTPDPSDGILGWVPGITDKLDLARQTGTDVDVPVADWIARADPTVAKALRPAMRIWPGGITELEAAVPTEPKGIVDSPLAQVRNAIGTEPLYSAGDRKLTLQVDQEASSEGYNVVHMYDTKGKIVGEISLDLHPDTRQLYIGNVNTISEAGQPDFSPNQFGPSLMRDVLRQLKALYPEYDTLAGERVSGARPEPRVVVVKLQDEPGKEQFEATRRILGQPLGAAPSGIPSVFGQLEQIKPEAAGLDAKTKARLDQMINDRFERDLAASQRRAEAQQKRQQTAEWRENRRAMREEVESTIRQRPDVSADLLIGSGEIWRDGKVEKVRQRIPLLESDLTDAQKATLPDHYYSKTGVPVDEVARWLGYGSGDAMLEDLAKYQLLKAERTPQEMLQHVIDTETDRQMEEKYGDNAQNILEAATDQALSESEYHLISEELQGKAMELGKSVIDKNVVRDAARDALGKTPISEISSLKYMTQMGKHATDAERALISGKPEDALVSLQRKQYAMALAMEARKAEKAIGQFDKLTKRLAPREVKTVDPEYMNYIHQIMTQIGKPVRRSIQGIQEDIDARGTGALEDFVATKVGQLREMPVWDQLYDPTWRKAYDDLTLDEFNAVNGSIKALHFNGRDELKIFKAGEAADFAEKRAEMIAQLERFPELNYDVKGQRGGPIRRVLRTYGANHMIIETLLNRWDEFDPHGVWNQYVMRDLIDGTNQEDAWKKEFAKKLREAGDDGVDLSKTVNNTLFRDPYGGGLLQFTRANLRTVLLNAGNSAGVKSNLWKMAKGYGLEPEEVMAWLHQHATKEDWDFAQKVWDLFGEIKTRADDMYRSLTGGVAPDHVRVDPIQTPFGTYRGGYYPAIWHPQFEGTSQKLLGRDPLAQENYVRATTPSGYTQTRTGYTAPMALDLDALPSRITQELHDIAMRPAVINASKVLYDKQIRSAIAAHYGTEVRDLMIPYLRDVANSMNYMSRAQVDFKRWSEFFRQNMVSTLVGLNPGTVMKHGPTAWVQSMQEVDPMRFLKAVKGLFSINEATGERNWQFAMENSLELQRRPRNYMETLTGVTQEMVPGGKFDSLRQTVLRVASTPVAFSDLISAVPTWLARYEKSIEEGASHGDAVYDADRAVRRAHGSTAITNRPAVMRDWNPWFTSVYSFFNHIMNRQAELVWKAGEVWDLAKEGQKAEALKRVPEISAMLFAYVLFPALVEEAVTPITTKDRESWGVKAAKAVGFTLGSSWIGVRDVANQILNGRDPSVGIYSTAYNTVRDVARDFGKNQPLNREHAGRIIQDAASLGGLVTGLIPAQVGRSGRFLYGVRTGVEHPKGPWGWLAGLRYGTLKGHASTLQNLMEGKPW